MSRIRNEKVRTSWRLLRRSPFGPGSIGSCREPHGSVRRRSVRLRLARPGAPVDPLIAPPGVAYVEQTSTAPTLSVTRVGAVSAGTDTQPVTRVWEKCSTMPVGAAVAKAGSPRRPLAAPRSLPTSDTDPPSSRHEAGTTYDDPTL